MTLTNSVTLEFSSFSFSHLQLCGNDVDRDQGEAALAWSTRVWCGAGSDRLTSLNYNIHRNSVMAHAVQKYTIH